MAGTYNNTVKTSRMTDVKNAIAAEAERLAREDREQSERKGRLEIARARLILSREQSEREAAQSEVERLLGEITTFKEAQERQKEEQKKLEKLNFQLAKEEQDRYNLAQEKELCEVLLMFSMEL
jgi:hypothetical protein